MLERSSATIAKLIYKSVSMVESLVFYADDATKEEKSKVEENYKNRLRELERDAQKRVEKIWNHDNLQKEQQLLPLEGMDLFSEETASVFGLTKKELLVTATASGAATGAGVDLLFGGATLLLGTGVGAIIGGVGAFFAFNELSEIKVLGQTLGKRYLEMGPMENRNFPYILLGRIIYHTSKIANRSHAIRGIVDLSMDSGFKERWLNDNLRKDLEKYHKKFRSSKELKPEELQQYETLINQILKSLIKG
jgi:hypothetical protein